MTENVSNSNAGGTPSTILADARARIDADAIGKAFDAGWAAHRDGIHWKQCGLTGEVGHAWQGGWASREAAGRSGVLS